MSMEVQAIAHEYRSRNWLFSPWHQNNLVCWASLKAYDYNVAGHMYEFTKVLHSECSLFVQFGIFWTVGEICSATSRLLVEESVADKFYALLKKRTEEIQVGNPLDQNTRLGPLVNESQFQKVLGYIEVRYVQRSQQQLNILISMLIYRCHCRYKKSFSLQIQKSRIEKIITVDNLSRLCHLDAYNPAYF